MTTPDRGLQAFRNWMRVCMRSKNLKGVTPQEVQAEFSDCARRFREARAAVSTDIDLEAEARRAAEAWVRSNMGR